MSKKADCKKQKKEKPISLHPLKPEEAISAFMQVDPEEYKEWVKKEKK